MENTGQYDRRFLVLLEVCDRDPWNWSRDTVRKSKIKKLCFQSVPESRKEILQWSRCEKLRFQRKIESQGNTVPLYDRWSPRRNVLFHEETVLYFVCRTKLPRTNPWFYVKKCSRGDIIQIDCSQVLKLLVYETFRYETSV